MTHGEILANAIKIAITNGWGSYYFGNQQVSYGVGNNQWWTSAAHFCYRLDGRDEYVPYLAVIFRQDFAKALWGDFDEHGHVYSTDGGKHGTYWWEHHLRTMAVADDRIKYLSVHINSSQPINVVEEIERQIDKLVLRYSSKELVARGGREALREAAEIFVKRHENYLGRKKSEQMSAPQKSILESLSAQYARAPQKQSPAAMATILRELADKIESHEINYKDFSFRGTSKVASFPEAEFNIRFIEHKIFEDSHKPGGNDETRNS